MRFSKILAANCVVLFLISFSYYREAANSIMNHNDAGKVKYSSHCSGYWERNGDIWEFGPHPSYLLAANASEDNQLPYELMSGRSILVIGGSTSRDLAADFMQSVLPLKLQQNVSNQWTAKETEGFRLFPAIGKHANNFQDQYENDIMQPLLDAGWRFEHLDPTLKTTGCSKCKASYSNIDYVATFENIRYEYSWKPEIFSPSDEDAFHQLYCKQKYDIVYLGRGLHDAAFYDLQEMSMNSIRLRFLALAKLLRCFPEETLIIFRSPYATTVGSEQRRVEDVTKIMVEMIADGHFDSDSGKIRSVVVDGMLLSSSDNAPKTFDGHHYDSRMGRSIWKVIFTVYSSFLGKQHSSLIPNFKWGDVIDDKFIGCGFGRNVTTAG